MFSNHKECHAQEGGSCKLLKHELHHGAKLDRCEGMEFDAVAVNEEGIPYFFKGRDGRSEKSDFYQLEINK